MNAFEKKWRNEAPKGTSYIPYTNILIGSKASTKIRWQGMLKREIQKRYTICNYNRLACTNSRIKKKIWATK